MSANIQGYDAILVRGTPRFRKDKKMVASAAVPAQIKAALMSELTAPEPVAAVTPAPREAGIAPIPPQELDLPPAPLEGADFMDEPAPQLSPEATARSAEAPVGMPTEAEMQLIDEIETLKRSQGAQGLSSASLEELAKELLTRFGIYTVFAGREPQPGDAHPFTGEVMNRYDLGIAYRAFTAALGQGRLSVDYAVRTATVRDAASAVDVHNAEIQRRTVEPGFDAPKFQSFAERTSVEGQNRQSSTRTTFRPNDPISEDVTAEPNLRGTTIREQW